MPLPRPRRGESRSAFVSRCMGSDVMRDDFPDQSQRAAVCFRQWRTARTHLRDAMSLVTFRVAPNGRIRTATYQGQDHLVVPVVALVAGVVNGVLAPAEVIQASLPQWNGVPLVVNHPTDAQGLHISANDSPVVAEGVIGRFWNCSCQAGRLRGELWINLTVTASMGDEVQAAVARLQAGQPLEVSTGFFAPIADQVGTYNGRQYQGVYTAIRPDHLALLPHDLGACSWEDGCGAPRVQRSDVDVRQAIYDQLAQEQGTLSAPIFIQFLDLDERAFVYRLGERTLMRRYSVGEHNVLSLAAEAQPVQFDTRLIPAGEPLAPGDLPHPSPDMGYMQAQKGAPMLKTDARITALLGRCQCEDTDAARTALAALPDPLLAALAEPRPEPKPEPDPEPEPEPQTVDALLGTITNPTLRETLSQAVATHTAQKAALIQTLTDAKCPFPREHLQEQPLATLEAYQAMMGVKPAGPPVSYLGQGAATPTTLDTLESWLPPSYLKKETVHG